MKYLKRKELAGRFISKKRVPNISNVSKNEVKLGQLYRFSCEVQSRPLNRGVNELIEVAGGTNGIKFRGDTLKSNWTLSNPLIQSAYTTKRDKSYTYQGLIRPKSKIEEKEGYIEYRVDFLLIFDVISYPAD